MHRLLYKGSGDVVVNATEIRFLDVVCVELRVRNKNDEQLKPSFPVFFLLSTVV